MKTFQIPLVAALLGILFFSGCGASREEQGYAKLNLADVSGIITKDGVPMPDVQVQFMENGSFSYGVTDSRGRYEMQLDSYHSGVKPGTKIVRLWTTLKGPGFDQLMQGTYPAKEIIPVQYNHESTLNATVEPNKSQTFDFDIKGTGKTVNAPPNAEEGGIGEY